MNKMKALIEKRNGLVEEMDAIVRQAEEEVRAFTDEETKKFDELKAEIDNIDATIERVKEERRAIESNDDAEPVNADEKQKNKQKMETRAFENFLRNGSTHYVDEETRAEVNLTRNDNGVLIPTTIANQVVETLRIISPIYNLSSQFNVVGNLSFPVYDEGTSGIACTYQEEFVELEGKSGTFKNVTLSGYLVGALTKISKSLINNTGFDVVSYAVNKLAEAMAVFIENEMINGTEKVKGLLTVADSQKVTAGAANAIATDDLVELYGKIPQAYRNNACFVMHPNTMNALRKLKDSEGNYMLCKDMREGYNYTLLGLPVYESENMPEMATGKSAVIFADMTGYYTKLPAETFEVNVLVEKYSNEHAVGVNEWFEFDGKPIETQKIAVLKMA